ncbi:MAG: gluconeogenesis factor YvcK family protein [Blastocatellia bacterium]|nr:gluconeogenesis factor YvcK family protein [Blastocatellia bacterium]
MPTHTAMKLVAIGGGTGLSTLLAGLKPYLQEAIPGTEYTSISLTAIVTVSDDGKSSGRLRGEFAVLPPGDIRNCLVALADDDQLMTQLFRHRFPPGNGQVGGHSLGNLIILALNQMGGDFVAAVERAREMLGIEARVLPSTPESVNLVARIGGREVRGQVEIKRLNAESPNAPIQELAIDPPDARGLPDAVQAILDADVITIGPGSLFTSVIANLLVKDIYRALARSRAKKIYICNVMTEFYETDGYSALDHVREILAYAPELAFDYAIFNSTPISPSMRDKYAAERAVPLIPPAVVPPEFGGRLRFAALPLASESRAVRHDPAQLVAAIFDVCSR